MSPPRHRRTSRRRVRYGPRSAPSPASSANGRCGWWRWRCGCSSRSAAFVACTPWSPTWIRRHEHGGMTEFLSTLPGGLVTGAVYALLAMGLVFTYKATRIPNFAYGAMATFVAFFHYDLVAGRHLGFHLDVLALHLHVDHTLRLGFWAAFPVSLVFAGLLGLAIE